MEQLIFRKRNRFKIAYGGRGSSKSFSFGIGAVYYALKNPGSRILCVRGTQNKISESSLQILKDAVYMMGQEHKFHITENTLRTVNGSEFLFYGAKNPHTFKSLQGVNLVWIDEATELSESAWDLLIPTIREDKSEIWISMNPEYEDDPVWQKFFTNDRKDVAKVLLNYTDNPYFPDVLKSEMEYDKSINIQRYEHIWLGKLRKDIEGALWKHNMFNNLSNNEVDKIIKDEYNAFEKIVIAVDPSGTSKITSDACGIVVVGKYNGVDRWCVLEDATKIMSPMEWANKVVTLYHKYNANKVIFETNYGADMISTIIHSVDRYVPLKGVRAFQGKRLRAEPVVTLYEQNRVDHLGKLLSLEDECLSFTGEDNKQKSPNRLDAMVYGIMHLAPFKKKMQIPKIQLSI